MQQTIRGKNTVRKVTMPAIVKTKPVKATTSRQCFDLKEFERFLLYTRRYSRYNVSRIMISARHLVANFKIAVPQPEDAVRVEETMQARGLTSTTIRHYLRALRYMAEFSGVEAQITLPKTVYKAPDYLSPAECRALLNACMNLRDLAIVAVFLYCGLRNKELCALHVEDVDLDRRLLHVRDRGQGIKNRMERAAHINDECARILGQWLAGRPAVPGVPWLFITVMGEPIKRDRVETIVRQLGVRAGIGKRVYPHLLRHTCATTMLHQGVAPTDVMIQLGHRSLRSTLVYLHGDLAGVRQHFKDYKY